MKISLMTLRLTKSINGKYSQFSILKKNILSEAFIIFFW